MSLQVSPYPVFTCEYDMPLDNEKHIEYWGHVTYSDHCKASHHHKL